VLVLWVRSYCARDVVSFGRAGSDSHFGQSIRGRVHLLTHFHARLIAPVSTSKVKNPVMINGGRQSSDTTWSSHPLGPQAEWNGGMHGYPASVEWHYGFIFQKYHRSDLFQSFAGSPSPVTRHRLVVVPYWSLLSVFAVVPIARLVQRSHTRRRRRSGHCAACGYDLRATPERCPECGAVPATTISP
jgi:hypothetical protein